MYSQTLFALVTYFAIIIAIGIKATHRQKNAADYLLGGRGLNYWVTAISAGASDMSIWLFMGLPVVVYTHGMTKAWVAIGLVAFMFLSWHFLAPKLRTESERLGAITLATFLEKKTGGQGSALRVTTALMMLFYLTIYISAGLMGLGYLFESLFGINYYWGCSLGIAAIFAYALVGGFSAVAWTDFFQGLFLLAAVLLVPTLATLISGGFAGIELAASSQEINLQLIPDWSGTTLLLIANTAIAWGFGYFGQPHILNKFMAIKHPNELYKAKWISSVWQTLALGSAVWVGLVALAYFPSGVENSELIFVQMVQDIFHPYFGGFILCAILAGTISTIDSQIIVLASLLAEDIYKKVFNTSASDKEVLAMSRAAVICIAGIAMGIASVRISSIFEVVDYAWMGLGSAFGPVLLKVIYGKEMPQHAALAGILTGGVVSALWNFLGTPISPMFPGVICSFLAMAAVTRLSSAHLPHQ